MSNAITGLLKGSKYKQKFPMDFIITGETNITVNVLADASEIKALWMIFSQRLFPWSASGTLPGVQRISQVHICV